jgi:hypothetical protein
VRQRRVQKLDLNSEYPCPCQKKGSLLPIVLTEAFGCNRCQKIFVLTEKGEAIEELSPIYNYKKVWRWNGVQWRMSGQRLTQTYLSMFLGIILVLAIVFGPLLLQSTATVSMIFWMVILLVLAAWLAVER